MAKAMAYGKAVGEGGDGEAEDIYLWEHGTAVEPWPEAVDGKGLLDALVAVIRKYVVLGQWAAEALALWVVHTYAFELRRMATYIGIESPEKRCGKTTLLTVLCELVNRPVMASNISSPAFYRTIAEKKPTMLIDEADTVLQRNRELRGILNAGCARKTGYVIRVTAEKGQAGNGGKPGQEGEATDGAESSGGSKWKGLFLGRFSSWCPKGIAMIKHLPETLADRCIIIAMQRKSASEKCERLRNLDGKELRRKCARWVADHANEIAQARPALPEDLNDRAADIWEPLLAIADLAGGDWPERARAAAVGLTAAAQEESPIGALLLDLLVMFTRQRCKPGNEWMKEKNDVRLFSREIVEELNSCADRPWMVLRKGKAVTELWLSQQLRPYGLRPKTMWIGEDAAKGYMEADFIEVFRRYIPKQAAKALIADSLAAQEDKLKQPPVETPKPEPEPASSGTAEAKLMSVLKQVEQLRALAKAKGQGKGGG